MIHTCTTLALNSSEMRHNLNEGLGLMVVGMSVVFVALIVIGQMIKWTERLLREKAAPEPAQDDPETSPIAPGAAASSAMVDHGITPQLVAVLTAAAIAAVNRPVRVHRVRHLSPQDSQGWVYSARAGMHHQPAYRKGRS